MKELDKLPNFPEIEARWQKFWEEKGINHFDKKSKKKIFSIDTPPPTVSGEAIHIGHAFSYTHFDIIGRYKRLRGFNVLQPLGFDDNGHPTERWVEKAEKVNSKEIDRQEFIKLVNSKLSEAEENFKDQFIKLGHAYDWTQTYSTISPEAIKIAQQSFLDLYKKGLAYRKEAPTIWCTNCQTALAQADLEDKERETKLNYINFELDDGNKVLIATTRPEFLPATVALFVNPNDKRYKKYIGKKAKVPLFDLRVPILSDEAVDPEFGSGFMMVCTFGDKEDIDKWKRHKLDTRIVVTKDGKLNDLGEKYAGMTLMEARQAIIDDLEGQGYYDHADPLKQTVSVCWRCPTPAEFIITKQWFINLVDFKKKWVEIGKKINWHPQHFVKLYNNWVKNLNTDWLISRQRHYGPTIPVWYCKKCGKEILPDEKNLPVNPEREKPNKKCSCGSSEFTPELDVFDTWMTSSLTPQLILGWKNKLLPMTLRPSARDIIRTWEFYTVTKSWHHFKSLPWTNTMISGMVFDPNGEEMHKSKGNAIDPLEAVKKYSSDAFRYWTISSIVGEDIWYQEEKLVHAQKILIKLWNSARFVAPNLKKGKAKSELADSWIISKLAQTIKEYTSAMDNYDPTTAMRTLEQFFMHDFCDFYVEMIKYRLYGEEGKSKLATQSTLYDCLLSILQMWAPIFPHVADELYSNLYADKKSIHLTELNTKFKADKKAISEGNIACECISVIRKWKQSQNLGMGKEVEDLTLTHPKDVSKIKDLIARTVRVNKLTIKKGKYVGVN